MEIDREYIANLDKKAPAYFLGSDGIVETINIAHVLEIIENWLLLNHIIILHFHISNRALILVQIYILWGVCMEFAKRKHPRLKAFDYSQNGCYFVTLCTEHNQPFLSRVGRGLAPAEGLAPADGIAIHLTAMGQIVEQELMALQKRYPCVIIEKHVIMPTHLHAVIRMEENTANARPRPTLMDVICTLKSLTTRTCNQNDHAAGRKIWQASFYEKIIRDEKAYATIWQYIETNPLKWQEDEYYSPFQ